MGLRFLIQTYMNMRKELACIGGVGFMLLCFNAISCAQTPRGNLHKTVIHRAAGGVIKGDKGSNHAPCKPTAQEVFMPQKKQLTEMEYAKYVQSMVNQTLHDIHKDGGQTGMPKGFHYNMSEWTQEDATAFAKGQYTFDGFEILLSIANGSVQTDKNGKYTKAALEDQAALQAIKPKQCGDWGDFAIMIGDAADASQKVRDGYRKAIEARKKGKGHGSVIELHEDVKYCGELPKGENPQVQALAVMSELKTAVRAA